MSDLGSSIAREWYRPVRVAEYHRMIDAGVFDEDDRLELLEGVIVTMSPQGARHARVIRYLTRALVLAVDDRHVVCPQLPLTVSEYGEPEPDVAVIPAAEDSAEHHPRAAVLVVEVASDSLTKDRQVKATLYARAGVPEYIVVNLVDDALEIHRAPDAAAGRYRTLVTASRGERIQLESLPGVELAVSDVLG